MIAVFGAAYPRANYCSTFSSFVVSHVLLSHATSFLLITFHGISLLVVLCKIISAKHLKEPSNMYVKRMIRISKIIKGEDLLTASYMLRIGEILPCSGFAPIIRHKNHYFLPELSMGPTKEHLSNSLQSQICVDFVTMSESNAYSSGYEHVLSSKILVKNGAQFEEHSLIVSPRRTGDHECERCTVFLRSSLECSSCFTVRVRITSSVGQFRPPFFLSPYEILQTSRSVTLKKEDN